MPQRLVLVVEATGGYEEALVLALFEAGLPVALVVAVLLAARAMHSIPTTVFPAPQGRTTTPDPPCSLPPA